MGIPSWEEYRLYLFEEIKNNPTNEQTLRSRYTIIRNYFGQKELNLQNIKLFTLYLHEDRGVVNRTKNKYLQQLRHMCRMQGSNLLDGYPEFPENQPEIYYLTDNEQRALIKCHPERAWASQKTRSRTINYRWDTIIMLYLDTGIRMGEGINLKWSDYNGDSIMVNRTKSYKPQPLLLSKKVSEYISNLPHQGHGYIIGGTQGKLDPKALNEEIRKRCVILGITRVETENDPLTGKEIKTVIRPITCHSLRHSFATSRLRSGVPIDMVSHYLGHSSTEITRQYTHYILEDQKTIVKNSVIARTRPTNQDYIEEIQRLKNLYKNTDFARELHKLESKYI